MATKEDVQKALNLFERGEDSPGGTVRFFDHRSCSVCPNVVALVDGKTHKGEREYLCVVCFSHKGAGLGPGLGQVILWGKSKV